MAQPKTTPGVRAGGRIDGTAATLTAGGSGIKSVVRTPAGDVAGDYTITVFDSFAINSRECQMFVNIESHLEATPFVASITQAGGAAFRVRTAANGLPADCLFGVALLQFGPVTSTP